MHHLHSYLGEAVCMFTPRGIRKGIFLENKMQPRREPQIDFLEIVRSEEVRERIRGIHTKTYAVMYHAVRCYELQRCDIPGLISCNLMYHSYQVINNPDERMLQKIRYAHRKVSAHQRMLRTVERADTASCRTVVSVTKK